MSDNELTDHGAIMDQIETAITGKSNGTKQTPSEDLESGSQMPPEMGNDLLEAMGITEGETDGQQEEGREPDAGDGEHLDTSGDGAQDGPGEEGQEESGTRNLKDFAEELGTNMKKLYSIEVDMGKDGPVSIGALKDAYRDQNSFNVEFAQREKALTEQATQLREAQQTLMMLQEDIKDHVDPGKLEALQEQQRAGTGNGRPEVATSGPRTSRGSGVREV